MCKELSVLNFLDIWAAALVMYCVPIALATLCFLDGESRRGGFSGEKPLLQSR
jgi:hypothetical protein